MVEKIGGFLSLLVIFCLNISFCVEAAGEENLNKLAVANNDLGVKLYHRLTENDADNVFFSPLSLSTAFGMLFVGTGGNSASQLRNVLGYNAAQLSSNNVPSAFNQYINEIMSKNEQDKKAYVLNLANEILLSDTFHVNTDYKEKVQKFFHADVKDVDFSKHTGQIMKDVNDWVSKKTNGKIDKLLKHLDPSTLFLILNAIYFKGIWKTEFNPKYTADGQFFNHGQKDQAKVVKIMHAYKKKYPYFQNDQYKVIELPYKGEDISMIILLPNTLDGLQGTEKSFTAEDIMSFRKQLRNITLNVALPKFKVKYSHQMASDFSDLGAKDIFNSRLADFSGITQSKGIFVNQVIHKAVLEVNEKGSEAAGGTGIGGGAQFVPPSFIVDHPFMFMILDKRNNLVLFLGRVTNL